MADTGMGKHLLLAGGGHAHIETPLTLGEFTRKGHRVALISIDPSGHSLSLRSGRNIRYEGFRRTHGKR